MLKMPNFKVTRRKKANVVPPKPVVEEKIDEMEVTDSDSSDEYIDEAIEAVKRVTFEENPKSRFDMPERPTISRPRFETPATPVKKPINLEPKEPYRPPRRRMNDPYSRKPTMDFQNPYSNYRRGGAKMRYGSHYGPGGEHLDTRTKAAMLYSHCFG